MKTPNLKLGSARAATANAAFTHEDKLVLPILALLVTLLGAATASAATYTSTGAGGDWGTTTTWSPNGTPTSADTVIIASGSPVTTSSGTLACGVLTVNSGATLTMYRPFTVSGATTISGTINFGSTSVTVRAMAFNGDVTLNSGAVWNETTTGAAATFSFGGNFANNATTFTAQNTTHNFTGTSKTLSGTTTLPQATFSGTYQNNGTLTVTATFTVSGTSFTQGANSTLNIGGTSSITTLTATASGNTVNYTGAAQAAEVTTYANLTLSGSGAKTFTTTPTVNGVLSLEGTATITVTTGVVTYGANATLQYNTATARTASAEEWISPFTATGGIIITNTGVITMNSAEVFGTSVPLTIASGATLATANFGLFFGGDFINNGGTFTAGSSPIVITNSAATQSIDGFTTTGLVSMTKTAGTATFTANVSGGGLAINGTGGTLKLGNGLTHTFAGTWTRTAGTLDGGSSTLNLSLAGTVTSGTGGTFTAGTGTVNYNNATAQTIAAVTYNNLTFSGGGAKTMTGATIGGTLDFEGTATTTFTGTATANSLTFLGVTQSAGTWGSTTSTASIQDNTHFASTGVLTVATGVGPVAKFAISALSSPQTAGTPFTIPTITAQDAGGPRSQALVRL